MKTTNPDVVEKSEHGPIKARAQRLFDDVGLLTAECLLLESIAAKTLVLLDQVICERTVVRHAQERDAIPSGHRQNL